MRENGKTLVLRIKCFNSYLFVCARCMCVCQPVLQCTKLTYGTVVVMIEDLRDCRLVVTVRPIWRWFRALRESHHNVLLSQYGYCTLCNDYQVYSNLRFTLHDMRRLCNDSEQSNTCLMSLTA